MTDPAEDGEGRRSSHRSGPGSTEPASGGRWGVSARLGVVALLVLLGVGVAFVGSSLGVEPTVTGPGEEARFSVSEANVTVAGAEGDVVIAELENVTEIEFTASDGTIVVETAETRPLSPADRHLAVTVARDNATVERALARLESYSIDVEPVEEFRPTDGAFVTAEIDLEETGGGSNVTAPESGEAVEFEVTMVESDFDAERVTIDRDPGYADDEAVVRIADPDTDERHVVVLVDLEQERVRSILGNADGEP